ncbi:preprotein translocase subunit SecG [Adhaeribacter rhizoryzae]|uniref:Protein-export membrane protein SecG n=1 Tax=Adhaeribacter rhizoryzae TaxID=2607907 RepID=A0A5M6DP41_9BACT|nr:preprotein translocase subunit SecG [Adhaeribacter rhizoryzae]KAA5547940.1 preprotein translocase subunit SecG [Adhaeribacter rhizoryzae]
MYIALISIIIFISILLVLVVLSQNSKGGGLSNQFGAGSSNLIGVKRTGDLLERLTWGLAIGLVVLSLSSNMIIDKNAGALRARSVNQERASQQGAAPAAPVVPQTVPNAGNAPAGTNNAAPAPATPNATTPATTDTTQQ